MAWVGSDPYQANIVVGSKFVVCLMAIVYCLISMQFVKGAWSADKLSVQIAMILSLVYERNLSPSCMAVTSKKQGITSL